MSQALPALESKKCWEALPEHERFLSTFGGCRHRAYDSLPSLNIFYVHQSTICCKSKCFTWLGSKL